MEAFRYGIWKLEDKSPRVHVFSILQEIEYNEAYGNQRNNEFELLLISIYFLIMSFIFHPLQWVVVVVAMVWDVGGGGCTCSGKFKMSFSAGLGFSSSLHTSEKETNMCIKSKEKEK